MNGGMVEALDEEGLQMTKKSYKVRVLREGKRWVGRCEELGMVLFSSSSINGLIAEAHTTIARETKTKSFDVHVSLVIKEQSKLDRVLEARQQAAEGAVVAEQLTAEFIVSTSNKFSGRDQAWMLGMSHQRVSQIKGASS